MGDVKKIVEKELDRIKLSESERGFLEKETREVVAGLEKEIKKRKIKASVFVGGSLAKGTIIKKKSYDIDIFVRFSEDKDISEKLAKIIGKKGGRVHGSRDYFRIWKKNVLFEIIPVLRISRPENARNITDLSFFHVSYVLEKIKNNRLGDDIMLAKAFCFSQGCYGAESYINGFSGYALELLVIYYKGFLNFIRAMKESRDKIVLDPGKFFKNKQDVLNQINEAKLSSPIVLVDPTFKERNAVAALSAETFSRFKDACVKFLKSPSGRFFEEKKINESKFNIILEAETDRQEGDIAGSKLLKFSRFLEGKMARYFIISAKEFDYAGKKARIYLKIKRKKEIIMQGPPINMIERLVNFKASHKRVFIKKDTAYAREKSLSFQEFFRKFRKENEKILKDMGIIGIKPIKNIS